MQRLRTFYASCMVDAATRDRSSEPTLRRWLARIDAVASPAQLQVVLRELHTAGVNTWFSYTAMRDRSDRDRHRGELEEGELGLRRDPYIDQSPRAAAMRDAYRALIARSFELVGLAPARASRDAAHVLEIETALAAASPPPESRYNPQASEHPTAPDALRKLAPHVDWAGYLALVGHPAGRTLNVVSPSYLQALDQVLAGRPLDQLRAALRWRFLDAIADALPSPLADEHFRFTAPAGLQRPSRDRECQLATVKALGVELSRQFAARALDPERRASAMRMAAQLRARMADQTAATTWLSPEGRAASAEHVRKLDLKIGYPDAWPATGAFALRSDGYLDNVLAARAFEQARVWLRARSAWRRSDWEMIVYPWDAPGMAAARLTIPNGFPDVFSNSIIVTAAKLQPPTFDAAAPLEVQYGELGALVGHELVHVIENFEFDADGQPRNTWTKQDVEADLARHKCVIDQADQFVVFGSEHVHGADTIDENVADLSGLGFAYAALAQELGDRLGRAGSDGLTPAQRFFISYAQRWCTAQTPQVAEQRLRTDHHGPPRFRVNGPLANMPEFAAAFSCKPDAKMVRPATARCQVW